MALRHKHEEGGGTRGNPAGRLRRRCQALGPFSWRPMLGRPADCRGASGSPLSPPVAVTRLPPTHCPSTGLAGGMGCRRGCPWGSRSLPPGLLPPLPHRLSAEHGPAARGRTRPLPAPPSPTCGPPPPLTDPAHHTLPSRRLLPRSLIGMLLYPVAVRRGPAERKETGGVVATLLYMCGSLGGLLAMSVTHLSDLSSLFTTDTAGHAEARERATWKAMADVPGYS